MFYSLLTQKTKKLALYVALGFGATVIIIAKNACDYGDLPAIQASSSCQMIATAEGISVTAASETPLEKVAVVLVAMAYAALLGIVFVLDSDNAGNKKYLGQIYSKCLGLWVSTAMYLMSLYVGTELLLLPYLPSKKLK